MKHTKNYKILVIADLYPNSESPHLGIFTEHRMRNMKKSGRVDLRVLSPVGWFPLKNRAFGKYAALARIKHHEVRHGIAVDYPRYPVIPKVGASLSGLSLALALIKPIRRHIRSGFDFDLIDAYYFYPDGVAAAILGKIFRKPVVITAYGNDLSLIANDYLPRRQIQWAAARAAGMTAVCKALKNQLLNLGAPEDKVRVVLHGVDQEMFRPAENRDEIRARLGVTRTTLLSVGHLIERKGHHFVISALRLLPDLDLIIAGNGEEEQNLRRLADEEGVADRVRFLGYVEQTQLPDYFNAVDALVLASSREGIANVLLEALACGTPVCATAIWGTPELISSPVAGTLIDERSAEGVADGVKRLMSNRPQRTETRRFVERYTWESTTLDHLALLDDIFDQQSV